MQGVVNLRREATPTVVVGNSNQQLQAIETVIDTGFTGFLSLPSEIIATLNLPWNAFDIVRLGDGSETLFDLYTAIVIWDGQYRDIWRTKYELTVELKLGQFELPQPREDYPIDYVLDGQQRLTSIFSVFQTELEPTSKSGWIEKYFDF